MRYDVLIAGGGFGGVYAARSLMKQLGRNSPFRIGLIAEENYMVFQPMLAEVCGSSISPRHVISPLRLLCPNVDVLCGRIREIAWPSRKLWVDSGEFTRRLPLDFQHLVLALGSVVDLSRVPGMPEHAYLMKNVGDALELRSTIVARMEEANLISDPEKVRSLLTFVVVGGGYSGVETAGQILDLLKGIHPFYQRIDARSFRVILVHSGKHLLPEMNARLGRYCQQKLAAQGLEIFLEQRVTSMTASKVQLQDGTLLASYTVISTVGNAPHTLVLDLCAENHFENTKGRITTDSFLRVKGTEDLWAAGDCALIPIQGNEISPPTAQFAMRQGTLLGQNLARTLRHQPLQPFTFKGVGTLASIGHRKAVADIFGFRFSGFIAWFLWRTLYLFKLPRLDRKLRVCLDWTLDLFFPRDISLLRPAPSKVFQEMHFQAGDDIFRAGEPALSFYVIKSGHIEIRDGAKTIRKLGAGDHFGEAALLRDDCWKFNCQALEESVLIAVNGDFFDTFSRASLSLRDLVQQSGLRYLPATQIQALVDTIPSHLRKLSAEDLMTKPVVTLYPHMTVGQALGLIREYSFNSIPVISTQNEPLGMIHQEALFEELKRGEINPQTTLDKLNWHPPCLVREHDSISDVVEAFYRAGNRKALVLDENKKLQGLISLIDLLVPANTDSNTK